MNIEPVRRILDDMSAPYALIGGRAMAARGYPRFTVDIDLLTSDPRVLDPHIWTDLERRGATVERPDPARAGGRRLRRSPGCRRAPGHRRPRRDRP